METWAQWFRGNFDKLLLFFLLLILIGLVLHMAHHQLDKNMVSLTPLNKDHKPQGVL